MSFRRLRVGELLAVAGAGCVIASLFVSWYESPVGALDAWDTFGPAVALLLAATIVALVLLLSALTERTPALPVAAAVWGVLFGLVAVIAALVRVLERPDHGEWRHEEKEARHHIDKAIDEIKKAAIDDGKDLSDHPPVDVHMDWPGRLHRAMELLDKAHEDISREEDNRFAQGLQQRAFAHIDEAKHEVREAIRIVESRY